MRRVLSVLSLVFLSISVARCDNGEFLKSQSVPSKLKVQIERQIIAYENGKLTIYAMDFHKEKRTLTFVCPCHISSPLEDEWLIVRVEGDSFKLTLLPDAEYNVKVQYWAPNTDKGVQYKISQ